MGQLNGPARIEQLRVENYRALHSIELDPYADETTTNEELRDRIEMLRELEGTPSPT